MVGKSVFDIRFLYYTPEIDLLAVINANDNINLFSSKLKSFTDMGPGFITFIKDPANRRNAVSFASGVGVLKNLLTDIGCKMLMLNVAQLEAAIRNRNTEVRDDLIVRLPAGIEDLCNRLNAMPQVEPAAEKISELLEIENRAEAARRKSVLAVDDDPICLNLVEAALGTQFDVYGLAKSMDYEKMLMNDIFDLFILDVEMPGLDGYQLLERIRKNPVYKNTPIMILTSYATSGNLQMAMDMQVGGFVRKPFEHDVLVNKVSQLLAEASPRTYKLSERKQALE